MCSSLCWATDVCQLSQSKQAHYPIFPTKDDETAAKGGWLASSSCNKLHTWSKSRQGGTRSASWAHTWPSSILQNSSFSNSKETWDHNWDDPNTRSFLRVKCSHNSTQKQIWQNSLSKGRICPPHSIICQVTLSFLPLLRNHLMKAAYVTHVHRRTDLWLTRDLFFICIANSLLKKKTGKMLYVG